MVARRRVRRRGAHVCCGGPYTITLTVTDNQGGTNSTTKDVTVGAGECASGGGVHDGQSGLAVTVERVDVVGFGWHGRVVCVDVR